MKEFIPLQAIATILQELKILEYKQYGNDIVKSDSLVAPSQKLDP